jgi:PadR family transcriptional regulator, regulatory protein PadR
MPPQTLGEFEQMVLLAILRLEGTEVYGVPITEEIERRTGRSVSPAAVYVTLRRLEEKGLVKSWLGEPIHERGGKPRRLVKIEKRALPLLNESRQQMDAMWSGVELAKGKAR